MKKRFFCIVGCGGIGYKRASSIKKFGNIKFVVDVEVIKANNLAKLHNSQASNDWKKCISDKQITHVIVCTSHDCLVPITKYALSLDKVVLVEKPGGIDYSEFKKLEPFVKKGSSNLWVGYNHRFHPAILKAYQIYKNQKFGDVLFLRGRYGHGGRLNYDKEWRFKKNISGGGELIDQGTHLIDLAQLFLGKLSLLNSNTRNYFWNTELEDNVFLTLENSNKNIAFLQASCTEWKNLFSFEIYFKYGKLEISGLGGSYGLETLKIYEMKKEMGPPKTTIQEYPFEDKSWELELKAFIQNSEKENIKNSFKESLDVLKIIEEVYEENR
jgi:predicted dehydrogenase